MGLSCSCPEYDPEYHAWCYVPDDDFTQLKTFRRKRCPSCNQLIDLGSPVVKIDRWRYPNSLVEERIHGEDGEIPLCPYYLCEKCGEIYLNLIGAGFCPNPEDNMDELLREYHEISGFRKD